MTKAMLTTELIAVLDMPVNRFYALRSAGVIPPPMTGAGTRKRYSPEQVREVRRRLLAAGEYGRHEYEKKEVSR